MACPIKRFIVRLRGLGIFARRNARFAASAAQIGAVLAAVVSFVSSDHAVVQLCSELRSGCVIADVSARKDQFSGEAKQRVTHGMDFGIEPAARATHGLLCAVFGSVGMLMDFAVRAVLKDNFRLFSEQQLFMEPVEEPAFGEAVEILEDGKPVSKDIGQRTPRAPVAQQVPQGVEMLVESSASSPCRHNVVVSGAPLLALIF